MRRPRFVLTSALAAVGLSALSAPAQQSPRVASTNPPGASSSAPVDSSADPMLASRAARYLLRNGQDYLSYREYDRALKFFRAVESRQGELSDVEKQQLRQGIARAQQGKREAVNGPHVVANPKGRPTNPPGSMALARPAISARAKSGPTAPEPVQLTSGTMPVAETVVVADAAAAAPTPVVVIASEPAPLDLPPATAVAPAPVGGMELPTLPAAPPAALPDLTSASAPAPVEVTPLPVAPETTPAPILPEVAPAPVAEQASPLELPTLGSATPAPEPANPGPDPAATPAPAPESATPPQPDAPATEPPALPAQDPAPAPVTPSQDPATIPAQAQPDQQPQAAPEPAPAPEATPEPAPTAAPSPVGVDPDRPAAPSSASTLHGSFLSPSDNEYIARFAQRTTDVPANDRAAAANPTNDPNGGTGPTQGSTRLELQRAPSPTEARPIRRIPVPEEFVPLGRRDWTPNRKYWAAAGTCHMILYFQDPVLERYGQGVEQALGPTGRFFSYPLDDPRQSNQRNQILQPFYSIGKFCFQVGTLPYKLVVDPPWEAEYDLGYYRPGDKIPPDTIMLTPTGVGPPLKGRKY